MSWPIVIGVILIVLVFGSVIAVFWWQLAARVAPYDDEIPREVEDENKPRTSENVVVIRAPRPDEARDEEGPA